MSERKRLNTPISSLRPSIQGSLRPLQPDINECEYKFYAGGYKISPTLAIRRRQCAVWACQNMYVGLQGRGHRGRTNPREKNVVKISVLQQEPLGSEREQ